MWEMSLVLQALWSPGLCLNPAIMSLQHPTPLVSEARRTQTAVHKVPPGTPRAQSTLPAHCNDWANGLAGCGSHKKVNFLRGQGTWDVQTSWASSVLVLQICSSRHETRKK